MQTNATFLSRFGKIVNKFFFQPETKNPFNCGARICEKPPNDKSFERYIGAIEFPPEAPKDR